MIDLGIAGFDNAQVIGRGAFGVVHHARQIALDRTVAIKIITAHTTADSIADFQEECRVLGLVDGCPQIITVYRTGVTDTGEPYLVMEYCPGGSLADRMNRYGRFPEEEVHAVAWDVAIALEHAHGAGILHRDIKPGNILTSRTGRSVLSDFGIARLANSQTTSIGGSGTIAFTAPEVLRGERSSMAGDIWSVGATLHSLVSGRSPYAVTDRDTLQAMVTRALVGSEPAADLPVSQSLRSIISRCLSNDPSDRPNAAELAAFLASAVEGTSGAEKAATSQVETSAPAKSVGDVPLHTTVRRQCLRMPPVQTLAPAESDPQGECGPQPRDHALPAAPHTSAPDTTPPAPRDFPIQPGLRSRRGLLAAFASAVVLTAVGVGYAVSSSDVARLVNGTVRVERGIKLGDKILGSSVAVTGVAPPLLNAAQIRALRSGVSIPNVKNRDTLLAELRASSQIAQPDLRLERKAWPDGNHILISWDSIDTRPGLMTSLRTDGGQPLANCPLNVTQKGSCTTVIEWGGRVRVILSTTGYTQEKVSSGLAQADDAPSLSIISEDKFEAEGATWCGSLITIKGQKPGSTVDWSADLIGKRGTVDHFDEVGDRAIRITANGDGHFRMGWGAPGDLAKVNIAAAGLGAELDLSGCA